MFPRNFKRIRKAVSITFLVLIGVCFLDVYGFLRPGTIHGILFFQVIPALMAFFSTGAGLVPLALVFIITIFAGRLYCSFLCPLGTFMDLVIRLKPGPHELMWGKRKPRLQAMTFSLLRMVFLFGGLFWVIDLLDPFSLFGRFMSILVRPLLFWANNGVSGIFEYFGYYALPPLNPALPSFSVFLVILGYLIVILMMSLKRGRLYCNSVCPVGTLLGFVSRFSVFRVNIDPSTCILCGKCERLCKAGCIDSQHYSVDAGRCVGCGNCLDICPGKSIGYRPVWDKPEKTAQVVDAARRRLSAMVALCVIGFPKQLLSEMSKPLVFVKNTIPVNRKHGLTPPGSKSLEHFTGACTACYLCVSHCPGNVLQPGLDFSGDKGVLVPMFDNRKGFCNFTCTECGHVCPSGAIFPLTLDEKQSVQVGVVHFIRENCIVITQKTECGACSEHCPTKAVSMTVENGLRVPLIDPSICIGCGACEYACPSLPHKSIYVEGNTFHRHAEKPKATAEDVIPVPSDGDFPF